MRRGGAPARRQPLLTRTVDAVFMFVRLAEFEILFFLFFFIAFLIFKDLREFGADAIVLDERSRHITRHRDQNITNSLSKGQLLMTSCLSKGIMRGLFLFFIERTRC